MKTNSLKNKLARVSRTLLQLLGVAAITLQIVGVVSAQQPGVGTRLLIPSAAYTDTFTSSLVIVNLDIGPNIFIISAFDTSGKPLGTPLANTLLTGQQFRCSNILKELGAASGSFGPIKVESMSNQLLSAVSEVRSNQGFSGFFPGQNLETARTTLGLILDVIDDEARGTAPTYRTNLGLNAVRPGSTNVTINLYTDSGQWVNSISTTLAANGLTQIDGVVHRLRGSTGVTRGYLLISSDQPIIAWASKIDNWTNDPSFQLGIEVTSLWALL